MRAGLAGLQRGLEESAAERDRLKAKLMKLREEHKRKMARSPRVAFDVARRARDFPSHPRR